MGAAQNEIATQGPIGLVSSNYGDAIRLIETFSEIIDAPTASDFAREIQSMSPEEKFTNSVKAYESLFEIEDIEDADVDDLPESISKLLPDSRPQIREKASKIVQIILREFRRLREQSIDRIISHRYQSRDYLLFSQYVGYLLDLFNEMDYRLRTEIEFDDNMELISEYLALFSHFVLISLDEKSEFDEEFLRDMARYEYYRSIRKGESVQFDPEEVQIEEITHSLLLNGAMDLYKNRDITVSRGAELVGISPEEFRNELLEHDIEIRFGPEGSDDMSHESSISKSS